MSRLFLFILCPVMFFCLHQVLWSTKKNPEWAGQSVRDNGIVGMGFSTGRSTAEKDVVER